MAEGVGFEPTVALRLRLISSQVPLTTQPPFRSLDFVGQSAYSAVAKDAGRKLMHCTV